MEEILMVNSIALQRMVSTYVAGGGDKFQPTTIYTSEDLKNWTKVDTGTNTTFHSVIWNEEQKEFAAVGSGVFATSKNGVDWTFVNNISGG